MRISGVEHIPGEGAVILACNHQSNIDPFFLGVAAPRQIHFMAKAELWTVKLLGRLVDRLGSFPVRRGEADREAVRRALEVLGRGAVLGIFPEGHRQPSGRLASAQPGFALFSLRPGVTTVPVAVVGTNQILRGRRLRFPKVTVTFGEPVDTSVEGLRKAQAHKVVTGRWESALAGLLGQPPPYRQPPVPEESA
jgi:1-acyl-sn-glycerol-3-phosphate acyltransferase